MSDFPCYKAVTVLKVQVEEKKNVVMKCVLDLEYINPHLK